MALQVRKLGFGFLAAGLVSFVLPMVGLQLKGLHRMPPEKQMAIGIVLVLLGALLAGLSYVFGSPGGLKRLAIGIGATLGGLVVLSVAANLIRGVGRVGVPPAAGPRAMGPAPAAGPGFDARPPWEREPKSDIRITLSNGKFSQHTSGIGTPMSGVDIAVDYQIAGGSLAPGETLVMVVQSKSGRGELDHLFRVDFERSGTISASSFTASHNDGPYTAWLEVKPIAAMPNSPRKTVSETISLNFENPPAPAPPPGFPVPPPGFPGSPP
jgi:hypothetical protein